MIMSLSADHRVVDGAIAARFLQEVKRLLERTMNSDPFMAQIVIRNLTKTYSSGGVVALEDINLEVQPNESVCILGPSGCGKTTLLRIIDCLIRPGSGGDFDRRPTCHPAAARYCHGFSTLRLVSMEAAGRKYRLRLGA